MWGRVIVGLLCCLVGAIWIGQGTNLVHGSFMSGHTQWTVIGAVLVALGLGLIAWAWRHRPRRA
jgi:uncharacterized integral membrane protein